MATVAQMIEWFKTLPQDAEVECGAESSGDAFGSLYMEFRPVDIQCSDVFDYTSEEDRIRYKGGRGGKVIVKLHGE